MLYELEQVVIVNRVVEMLNERGECSFSIESKSEYGISGAWTLLDISGRRFVLKMENGSASHRMKVIAKHVDSLRDKGYLAPRHYPPLEVDGVTAWLQDFVPG